MTWFALPFGDKSCKKLRRVFEFSQCKFEYDEPKLVIFGPYAEFIEPFVTRILYKFNIWICCGVGN